MTRRKTVLPLAAVLALVATAVLAQPPAGSGRGPGAGVRPQGLPPGAGLLHGPLAARLDLSDEQRDEIRSILETQRETVAPWHEDLSRLAAELEAVTEAEPLDEEAVRAVATQMADVRIEMAVHRARVAQEVRSVLTPEQREELGEAKAELRQRREQFGERGPRGRGLHRRGPRG